MQNSVDFCEWMEISQTLHPIPTALFLKILNNNGVTNENRLSSIHFSLCCIVFAVYAISIRECEQITKQRNMYLIGVSRERSRREPHKGSCFDIPILLNVPAWEILQEILDPQLYRPKMSCKVSGFIVFIYLHRISSIIRFTFI